MNSLAGAVVLTKTGGILGPIAGILGWIMDLLFRFTSTFGIENIGLCIILFTLVTKILMMPLTIKQQKSSKLMAGGYAAGDQCDPEKVQGQRK